MTLVRPMVEAGRLVPLFRERLKAEFAHYLVYPPRSQTHAGLAAFRTWLLAEAADYTRQDALADGLQGAPAAKKRARTPPRTVARR